MQISQHYSNDDLRNYRFERNSRIPCGTFPRHYQRWAWLRVVADLVRRVMK